ncbi:MAG: hypothetical protein ABII76_27605 [Pseudomonadota bacterium]
MYRGQDQERAGGLAVWFDWMYVVLSAANVTCALLLKPLWRFTLILGMPVAMGLSTLVMVLVDRSPTAVILATLCFIAAWLMTWRANRQEG